MNILDRWYQYTQKQERKDNERKANLSDKSVNKHRFVLPKTVATKYRLDVMWRIPRYIKYNNPTSTDQINPKSTSFCGNEEEPSPTMEKKGIEKCFEQNT